MPTRRDFLGQAGFSALGLSLPIALAPAAPPGGYLDLHRTPDSLIVQTDTGERQLSRGANGRWTADDGLTVTVVERPDALGVELSAPATAVKRLRLRWRGRLADATSILGDAWERSYGDLEWRGGVPDRVMPWYIAIHDGALTHAYGVRTGAAALCFWQVDAQGISLWADVRSGGVGLQLGNRVLAVCDVVCRPGRSGESAFVAIHAFCRTMCARPPRG